MQGFINVFFKTKNTLMNPCLGLFYTAQTPLTLEGGRGGGGVGLRSFHPNRTCTQNTLGIPNQMFRNLETYEKVKY